MNENLLKQLAGDLDRAFVEIDALLENGSDAETLIYQYDTLIMPAAQQLQASDAGFQQTAEGINTVVCGGVTEYFKGLQFLKTGDLTQAIARFSGAEQTLSYFQANSTLKEIANMASALANYWEGVASVQNMDVSAGIKKLEEARKQVKNSGKYGAEMAKSIDLMQGEIFFLSGVKSVMQSDYANGLRQMHLAARTTKEGAEKNFAPESDEYRLYTGLSLYYEAFAEFQLQLIRFNSYEFDTARDKSITGLLNDAAVYIKSSPLPDVNAMVVPIIELMYALDQAIEKMSGLILERLKTGADASPQLFMDVRQLILEAQDAALRISAIMKSELGNAWLQTCNNFSKLIGNLERFLSAKDVKPEVDKNINIETLTFHPNEVGAICKDLIAQNKIADALINLNKFFANKPDKLNDVIQTQQKWADLSQRIRQNIISEGDAGVEKAKIVQATLFLTDGIIGA